jgi:peptidyl-prolyl cis-trans isomerase C
MTRIASLSLLSCLLIFVSLNGQEKAAKKPAEIAKENTSAIAAKVNGQPIPETALIRALKGIPDDRKDTARKEILNYLIDNLLVDQHLQQLGESVSKEEIQAKMKQIWEEVKQQNGDFSKLLKDLMLTDEELRATVEADLRWEKYTAKHATDDQLKKLFNENKEMYDGTMVRVRHILRVPESKETQAVKQEKAHLLVLKKQITDEVAKDLAKLPKDADKLAREKARMESLEANFGKVARKESADPGSKDSGGDLPWFPRMGNMVEPFAKAAFSLKPFEFSDVVETPFGLHLILLTERKDGPETTFEEAKDAVREVFNNQLKEKLVERIRPNAKIVITKTEK